MQFGIFKCSKTRPFDRLRTGLGSSLGSLVAVLVAAMTREIARGRALEPNGTNISRCIALKGGVVLARAARP